MHPICSILTFLHFVTLLCRTPVVLRKQITSKPKSELALHQAKAKGQIETVARGPASSGLSKYDDNEVADFKQEKTITLEFKSVQHRHHQREHRQCARATAGWLFALFAVFFFLRLALQKARQAKGLSQGDLAKMVNVTQKVIQDYESGKAVPVGNLINLLNRKLDTVLPKIPKVKKAKVDLDGHDF